MGELSGFKLIRASPGPVSLTGKALKLPKIDDSSPATCPDGLSRRSVAYDQETTPQPGDVGIYRLNQNASGALVSCRTTVTLANARIDAIIDTGAARTMLAFALYKKLEADLPSLRACKANLRGAGGELCNVQGEVELHFLLEGVPYIHNVIVSSMPCVEMLLGIDFLYRNGAIIDCQFGRLIIKHQNVVIRSYGLQAPFSVRTSQSYRLAPESELLLECHVDHFFRNKEGMFEVCAVLGEGIIILPGLVICDDKGAMRIPVKNTGQRFHEVMQDQTIGTFSLRDDGSLTVYSLVDGESVEGGKPGSTVSSGLIGSKLPDPYAIKGGVARESDAVEYSGGSRDVRTLCADCGATCYPVLEREHGNATPGVDTSSTAEVLVKSQRQLTKSVSLDCSSVHRKKLGIKNALTTLGSPSQKQI